VTRDVIKAVKKPIDVDKAKATVCVHKQQLGTQAPDVFGATASSTNERAWVRERRRSRQSIFAMATLSKPVLKA